MNRLGIALSCALLAGACKNQNTFSADGGSKSRPRPQAQSVPRTVAPTGGGQCTTQTPRNYNFVIVFDTSDSQNDTDPRRAGPSGAKSFIDKLAALNAQDPMLRAEVAIVRFSGDSSESVHKWMPVNQTSAGMIKNEIDAITRDFFGTTSFVPALQRAASLLAEAQSGPNAKKYVVFMTDGQPDEGPSQIIPLIDQIAAQQTELIAVAAGDAITPEGASIVESMARPSRHNYHRAVDPTQINNMWNDTLSSVSSCHQGAVNGANFGLVEG